MWWSALLLGLISSLHCVGMCAPLQVAAISAFRKQSHKGHLLLYHASRILTYGLLGGLVGLLGKGLGLQAWQQQTSLLGGLFLLLAFAAFYLLKLDRHLLRLLFPYLSRLRGKLQQNRAAQTLYFSGSGFINGLLPCGMVYLALFPAMGSGTTWASVMYMLFFGLGTLPLLALANLGGLSFLKSRSRWVQRLIPLMIVSTALLLILRGMDLGIPYLSPQLPPETEQTAGCR